MNGFEIANIRKKLGLNRRQFAEILGVAPNTTLRWEKYGDNKVNLDPLHHKIILFLQNKVRGRKKEELKSLGDNIVEALVFGGTLFALAYILKDLFSNQEKRSQRIKQ